MAENTATKQRRRGPSRPFQPGQSCNPAGKPPGARHKATRAAEALLDGESEALIRKAIELALDGDAAALRLCIDRILPRRERPVSFELPMVISAGDSVSALNSIVTAVAQGDLTPSEAGELSDLLGNIVKAIEAV